MSTITMLIRIVGSVGLFLYGMQLLSDGLQKAAGAKLKFILGAMTSNRILAVFTGLFITLVIQSSSATTVMVVSFVSAGLMTLKQSIGVILGANIGTTVTAWIVSLLGFKMDISILAMASIALSLPLYFSKDAKKREISEIMMGFGFLFIGLEFLQDSMPDISASPQLMEIMSIFNNDSIWSILACVVIGALLTCIVQSSSATMAITITLAFEGWIGVWAACALCLGQNIGTTITAFIASLGTGTDGRRAAMAHTLFNVTGSVLVIILLRPFVHLVNAITPGDILTATGTELQNDLPVFLSMFHTLFNLINTALFLPFVSQFAKLIEKLVPKKEVVDENKYTFRYIGSSRVDSPELYLIAVKNEIKKMGELTLNMFKKYENICFRKDDITEEVLALKRDEDFADQMQDQLIDFCIKMQMDSQTPTNASVLQRLVRIIDETESITDSIYNNAKLMESKRSEDLHFTERAKDDLRNFNKLSYTFLELTFDEICETISSKKFLEAEKIENDMDTTHQKMVFDAYKDITSDEKSFRSELLYLEIIRNLENIGDYCHNIVESEVVL